MIPIRRATRRVAGIDGCRGGWCLALGDVEAGVISIKCEVLTSFAEAVSAAAGAADIAVDIPIGLMERGDRACDVVARLGLGKRHVCVFPTPPRPVLAAASYADANSLHRELCGKGLSRQSFAIAPKIAEVDRYLRAHPGSHERIWEVHPELCFMALNCGVPLMIGKAKLEGKIARRALLLGLVPDLDQTVREALTSSPRSLLKEDDVLDAVVACVTAAIWDQEATVSADAGESDAFGLPIQMRCPAPSVKKPA